MLEVAQKLKELKQMSRSELRVDAKKNPIKVVVAPNGEKFVVDGHHRVMACWLLGMKKLPCKVVYRFSRTVSCKRFWAEMIKRHWAHPYGVSGDGPQDALYFPADIRGVGNDPYRSLAYLVREKGGYRQSDVTFADFQWAEYFRDRKLIRCHFSDKIEIQNALPAAMRAARSPKAKRLPGYKGRRTGMDDVYQDGNNPSGGGKS